MTAGRLCAVEDCNQDSWGKSLWCQKHKMRMKIHGILEPENKPVICVICESWFTPPYQQGAGDQVKTCSKKCKTEHQRRRARKNNRRTPEAAERYRINAQRNRVMEKFGLTLEEYNSYRKITVCAICGHNGEWKTGGMGLDHNHVTGIVREPLCGPCNKAIGLMQDSPTRLRLAAEYLEKHGG